MKSKYSDADVWLAVAVQAINGAVSPAIGGSDASVKNAVDIASRVADEFLVQFRAKEASFNGQTDGESSDQPTQGKQSGAKK